MKHMGQYHLRMQIQKEKKKTDKIPAKNSCITVRKITHHDWVGFISEKQVDIKISINIIPD